MEEERVEAVGIIFLVVIFIIILTFSDIQKKKHYNSFIEVLDGDILSYQCQRTGIVIDTKQRTVRFFDKERDKTYSYDNIREINYTLSDAGKFYGNGTLRGMNNAAIANGREQLLANQRSGINILTDDIKKLMWKINVPLENKTTSKQELCERWLLVFKQYVF